LDNFDGEAGREVGLVGDAGREVGLSGEDGLEPPFLGLLERLLDPNLELLAHRGSDFFWIAVAGESIQPPAVTFGVFAILGVRVGLDGPTPVSQCSSTICFLAFVAIASSVTR